MASGPLALVLAGGGARGAYQAGVLRCVFGTWPSRATRLVLEAVAVTDDPQDADLLSYLFFGRSYAERLIDLAYRDAEARQEDIAAFLGLGDPGVRPIA